MLPDAGVTPSIRKSESMVNPKIARRAEAPRAELNRQNHLYFVLDRPEISDGQYDDLIRELREIEGLYPDLLTPDSPTQRVGAQPAQGFANVQHHIAVSHGVMRGGGANRVDAGAGVGIGALVGI
mgnify:CR=1 FL=1